MAVTNTPAFLQALKAGAVAVANADGTSNKTVITAGGNGTKVVGLIASSIDSASRDFYVMRVRAAVNYILATVTVPANSGFVAGTPGVDLMASIVGLPKDQDGQSYLSLESGDTLVVALTTGAVTAAKAVYVQSVHADF